MAKDPTENQESSLLDRLRNKFRMIIINDETFEEQLSMQMSLMNIIVWSGMFVVALIIILISIIAFTSLREYIPGYSDVDTKKNAAYAVFKSDSLQHQIDVRDQYINRIRLLLKGEIEADSIPEDFSGSSEYKGIKDVRSTEDSLMRKQIEEQEQYSLDSRKQNDKNLRTYFFFTPVKGVVTASFNTNQRHYGVDIVTKEDEPIKAVMDGTVTFADFTTENGYVIQLQHRNNLISVYKHCSVLLKKEGVTVTAGQPIAVVGNTGEQSTGPHLHFELWENGNALDPQNYIIF